MAALKVQSLKDIVAAYGQSLGYYNEGLDKFVHSILLTYGEKLNQDDVISSLDDILFSLVKKYIPSPLGDKAQALARFKTIFLLNDGADDCGVSLFENGEISQNLRQLLKSDLLLPTPPIKITEMKVQKIETLAFFSAFNKLFHFLRKG